MFKFGFMEWRPRREMVKGEKGSKTQLMGRKIPSTFKRNKRKAKIAGSVQHSNSQMGLLHFQESHWMHLITEKQPETSPGQAITHRKSWQSTIMGGEEHRRSCRKKGWKTHSKTSSQTRRAPTSTAVG